MQDLLKKILLEGSTLSLVKSMTRCRHIEVGKGCSWLSKIAIEEKVVTNWEYQSTMEDKGSTEAGRCFK